MTFCSAGQKKRKKEKGRQRQQSRSKRLRTSSGSTRRGEGKVHRPTLMPWTGGGGEGGEATLSFRLTLAKGEKILRSGINLALHLFEKDAKKKENKISTKKKEGGGTLIILPALFFGKGRG